MMTPRRLIVLALTAVSTALLAACGGAPSAAAPSSAAIRAEAAASGRGAAAFQELVAAAQKEGSVVLAGPPTPGVRSQVPAAFKARYGITIEYLGGRGGDLITRLRAERAAGQYTVDVVVGGADSIANQYLAEKMLDPIRPGLLDPLALDGSKWKKGKLWFIDPDEQYALRLASSVQAVLAVNTTKIGADEIKLYKDLLNPKYKGLMAQDDPTVSGSGSNTATQIQAKMGEDFLHRLYVDQKVTFAQDRRQLSDWLGRGTYPITINPNNSDNIQPLLKDGFPIKVIPSLPDFPASVSSGSGIMTLFNHAPHPNAARLLTNWLASPEGMLAYTKNEGNVPTRTDVDDSWAPDYAKPQPGIDYYDNQSWEFATSDKVGITRKVKIWVAS